MTMFEKKSVYQSNIVEKGGVVLRKMGAVRKGKFGMIMPINVQGDPPDHEHWFVLENDGCVAMAHQIPEKQWVTLTGAGSRAAASISWAPAMGGGGYVPIPAPAPGYPPQQGYAPQAPTPQPQYVPNPAPKRGINDLEDTMIQCLLAAGRVVSQFNDEFGRNPTQVDQDIAVSLFIEQNRRG